MATVTAIKYTSKELSDILTTALEGGIGYWSVADKIKRSTELNVLSVVLEPAEGDDFIPVLVEPWMLQSAIDRIVSGDYDNLLDTIIEAVRSGDLGDMDAEVCDCIVQLALFGSVVYG